MKKVFSSIIIILSIIAFSLGAVKEEDLGGPREKAFVKTVIDGDTVMLKDGRTVRLIGIDSPETRHPTLPPQRFGKEAADYLRKLAENRDCELEFEEGNSKDKHGRAVAYLYVGGLLLNEELLKNGFAYVYTKYPFRLKEKFITSQQNAIKNRKGLWKIKAKSSTKKVKK